MGIVKNTLINEIRVRLGSPSTSELTDAAIGFSIDSALSELCRLQPYYKYYNIDIVKDTAEYSVDPAVINVRGFWFTPRYKDTLTIEDWNFGEFTTLSNEYTGLKVFHSPSLMNIIEEKWERMRSRHNYTWEFNPDELKLLVLPTPKESGKGAYKGIIQRTLSTINVMYEEPFKDLARALTMETWVFKLGKIKSIPVGVGKIDYETKDLTRAMRDLKADAIRRLSVGGSAVVIG